MNLGPPLLEPKARKAKSKEWVEGSPYSIVGYILGYCRDNGQENGNYFIVEWGKYRFRQVLKPFFLRENTAAGCDMRASSGKDIAFRV